MRFTMTALLLALTASAHAQSTDPAPGWPNKPLRVVVPFTAGSATDAVARIVTERLGAQLGQTIVAENRPGAGGTIGVGVAAKANPDGYTLLVHSSSYTVTPTTYPNTPYVTLRDLSGITPLANLPTTLEAGIPNSDYNFWVGMVVPAKTPDGVITKIHQNTVKALHAPDITERMTRLGAEQMIMTPREFDTYIKAEIGINAALVKAAKINVN